MKFLSFLFFSALTSASANIPVEFLGNIDGLLNPDFKEASFSGAISFWESGLARKIRLLGAYGKTKEGRYCHFQISKENKDKDCPQDAVMEFTQRLFPAPTGDVAVNTSVSDPVSRLTPKILGMMVEWYARNRENLSSEHSAKLIEDLWEMLLPELIKQQREFLENKIKRFKDNLKNLEKTKEQDISTLRKRRAKIFSETDQDFQDLYNKFKDKLKDFPKFQREYLVLAQEIQEIDTQIEQKNRQWSIDVNIPQKLKKITIKKPLKEDIKRTFSKEQPDESDALALAYLFIKAFVEALIYERENPGVYPEHTAIHSLMDFVYKKAGFWPSKLSPEESWKEHVAEFLEAAPSLLRDSNALKLEVFKEPQKLEESFHEPLIHEAYWTQKIYEISKKSTEFPAPYGTGEAVCLPLDQVKEPIGQILDKIKATPQTFSDCGESTLRSFFNIVLYNQKTKKIDLGVWNNIKTHHQLSPLIGIRGIEAFFTFDKGQFLDPQSQDIALANHLWNVMVTSHLKGVKYNGEGCNIKSLGGGIGGLGNMLKALEAILGVADLASIQPAQEMEIPAVTEETEHNNMDRVSEKQSDDSNMDFGFEETHGQNDTHPIAQKLNGLCHLFSREGFKLTWAVLGTDDEESHTFHDSLTLEIQFSINGEPAFNWSVQDGHFQFESLGKDWRSENPLPPEEYDRASPTLLGWYLSDKTLSSFKESFLETPLAAYQLAQRNGDKIIDAVALMSKYAKKELYSTALRWTRQFKIFKDRGLTKDYTEKVHYPWNIALFTDLDLHQTQWKRNYQLLIRRIIKDTGDLAKAREFFQEVLKKQALNFSEKRDLMDAIATAFAVQDNIFLEEHSQDIHFQDATWAESLKDGFCDLQEHPYVVITDKERNNLDKIFDCFDQKTSIDLLNSLLPKGSSSETDEVFFNSLLKRITDKNDEHFYDFFRNLLESIEIEADTKKEHKNEDSEFGENSDAESDSEYNYPLIIALSLLGDFLKSPQEQGFKDWAKTNGLLKDEKFWALVQEAKKRLTKDLSGNYDSSVIDEFKKELGNIEKFEKEFNERKAKFLQDLKS